MDDGCDGVRKEHKRGWWMDWILDRQIEDAFQCDLTLLCRLAFNFGEYLASDFGRDFTWNGT